MGDERITETCNLTFLLELLNVDMVDTLLLTRTTPDE